MDGVRGKINGEPAILILVTGGEGAEAKPCANGWLFTLYFIHSNSPSTIAPDIHAFQF
jgi:hypothetical protein